MPQKSRTSFQKRQKERLRQQKQEEKRVRRFGSKERKAQARPRTGDEDPDIAGIRPGPQPPAEEDGGEDGPD